MFRPLISATARLVPVAASVAAAALMAGTGLITARTPVLAQSSIQFGDGGEGEVERLVKENVTAGGPVGVPVAARGAGTLTYSLSGADAASFTINRRTGQILLAAGVTLDFESGKTVYRLVVTATGQPGQTASVKVTVIVEDVNEPPEFDTDGVSFESFEVKENSPAGTNVGDPIKAADPEDDEVTYSLAGPNAGTFAVDALSGQVKTRGPLNFEARNSYRITIVASDPSGSGLSAGIDVTISVADVDTEAPGTPEKPSVSPDNEHGHMALVVEWTAPENAGPQITNYVLQYRIDGSGEKWKQITVGAGVGVDTLTGLQSDTAYEVRVRAVNDEGEGQWSQPGKGSTYAAQPVNSPPGFAVNAATALTVIENARPGKAVGTPYTASDADPQDTLVYSITGADSGLFSIDDSNGQISVGQGTVLDHESPADSDGNNDYELTVRVTDGKDEGGNPSGIVDDSIEVTIRVTDVNEPPVFSSADSEIEFNENSAEPLPTLSVNDPEGHGVTWSLGAASPDGGSFTLSGNGTLSFKSAPDFESPRDTDRDNDYELIVIVTDDGLPTASSRMTLTIRVVNIDEQGTVGMSTLGPQLGVRMTAELTDPDGAVSGESWQWIRYSGSREEEIGGATDSSYFPTQADDGSRLRATVTYSDRQGPGKYVEGPLTRPVGGDPNSPPAFAIAGAVTRRVAENTRPGANIGDPVAANDPDRDDLTYSLSGADSSSFAIDESSGQIKTKDPLDHERRPVMRLTVTAVDPGGLSASVDVTVTVTDVDTEAPGKPDPPSVGPNRVDPVNSLDIEWKSPANSGPAITRYVVQYRVRGSGVEWKQRVVGGRADRTTISGIESDTTYEAQVHAVNAEGTGQWSESGFGSATGTPPANTPPEFGETAALTLSIDENVPGGTPVGRPITAADLEDDELIYRLAGADSTMFVVDHATGQIRTAGNSNFDYEAPADSGGDNRYELRLEVTDGRDGDGNTDDSIDDEIVITVVVANVNESPEFPSLTVDLQIEEDAPKNTNVGDPIIAVDPDSDELTYSLAGVDTGAFGIVAATGQIFTTAVLDYESNSSRVLTVVAVDDGNFQARIAVIVRVLNVNEAPVVETEMPDLTLVESEGAVKFDVSAYFSDPDGDDLRYAAASTDSGVIRTGLAGAVLTLAPIGLGTATIEVSAIDSEGLNVEQSFAAEVVLIRDGPGGGSPLFPVPPQASGDPSDSGADHANLLSETAVIVVPDAVLVAPGQAVVIWTIAFNQLGDPLPASAEGVVCTWSSDGGGTFAPNSTESACSTTFTSPDEGSGKLTVRVDQGSVTAVGTGEFEVSSDVGSAPGVVEEEVPEIPFPAGVAGSTVSRHGGASITSMNGLTMNVPPGAIEDDYLGAYIEELTPSSIEPPATAMLNVGSHAGNFVFTDLAGDPIPDFRTNLPVRICLPITQEDLDAAAGGAAGVHVVYRTPGGQLVPHHSDIDLANMAACANVDRFSLYFVGLDEVIRTPAIEPTPAQAETPVPAGTATQTPAGTPVPPVEEEPTPVPPESGEDSAEGTPGPAAKPTVLPTATPILPHTGGAAPGPQFLLVAALAAAVALGIGLTLKNRTGHQL